MNADSAETEEDAEAEPDDADRVKAYFLLPIAVPAVISAFEMIILQQSVTGAVRNCIVAAVRGFAVCYSCRRHISSRTAVIMTVLGTAASLQAFLPEYIMPIAGFGVIIALLSADAYTGAFSLFLFAALPFLSMEGSYEHFLFCIVTGMIGIALIYSRKETGKYREAHIIFTLVYVILFTALIIMKRSGITPGLIMAPIAGLIMNIIIMELSGYSYYTNIVKREQDLYLNVVDPEHPLLIRLKGNKYCALHGALCG